MEGSIWRNSDVTYGNSHLQFPLVQLHKWFVIVELECTRIVYFLSLCKAGIVALCKAGIVAPWV